MLSLSIVIPVFNEDKFIKKNINSLLSNSSRDFEIIIFDNCSDDNTLNILKSFNDARLKITKQPKKVSPAKNHKDAIKKARGSHIFLAGGDDFFHHEVFDKVIPFLEKDKITFCKMELVDTKNVNKVIGNQNTEGVIKNIFEVKDFLPNFLRFINHDTLMHSFIPKNFFQNIQYYNSFCIERFWPWMCIHVFSQKERYKNYNYFPSPVLITRQYKNTEDFKENSYILDTEKILVTKSYVVKSLGSIYNSLVYFFFTKNIRHLCMLLFATRSADRESSEQGGFYSMGKKGERLKYLAPLASLLLSPVIDLARLIRLLIKSKIK